MKILLFILLMMPTLALSDVATSPPPSQHPVQQKTEEHPTGLGEVAGNLTATATVVSDFVGSASVIIGTCCIFASILRYSQYRVNPLMTPLSTIITLLVVGIVLVCLPFVYLLTESGIPFVIH